MKTAIARLCRYELECAHPARVNRKARHAKLALRRDARREAGIGLIELEQARREAEATRELAHQVRQLGQRPVNPWNSDREQYEFKHLSLAAGLPEAVRDRLKERLFGPKCPSCGLRGCAGDCESWDLWD